MLTNGVLIQNSAECLAVSRKLILNLEAGIGKDCKGNGMSEIAAIKAQELVDLGTLVSNVCATGIDVVNHQDDFDGRLPTAQGSKKRDGLWHLVIQNREVSLSSPLMGAPDWGVTTTSRLMIPVSSCIVVA